MKIIIGLGNPGAEYKNSRHNFGWQMLDFLAEKLNAENWQSKKKFRAEIAEIIINDEKIILVKPQTFYNLSGESIRAIRDFYDAKNSDILVIHDEIDLPIGTIRTRENGSAAGNNGIANIISHIGADFARIRVGSGKSAGENGSTKPQIARRDYVLAQPNKSESDLIKKLAPKIEEIVADFINGNFAITTHKA